MYHSKDCSEKFIEHIEDKVNWLYATLPQRPMTELTDVLKKEHEAAKNTIFDLKSLMSLRTER